MVGLRKASAYSKRTVVPYTRRSKRKGSNFIKAVPAQSIVKFTMGQEALFNKGNFPFSLTLVADEKAQIRANALEACRQYINKKLDTMMLGQYVFKVLPYPHHVQRENKMLTGAGADRMQTGMSLSFGKAVGRAAIVNHGTRIFFMAVANKKAEDIARHLLHEIKSKLPCRTKIVSGGVNVIKQA